MPPPPMPPSRAATTIGPLHGVPLHVKDLVNTKGVRTTFGSFMHEHNVPAADSVSVARLKAAGAILFAKTTTPEFGHMPWTEAPLFGRTRNAWDATRTSGGSSGGAAVACAAGVGPLGHRHRCRRLDAHSRRLQRRRRLQAVARPRAARHGARSVRQPLLHHADDAHRAGHGADAGGHGGPASRAIRTPSACRRRASSRLRGASGDLKGLRVAWRPLLGNTVIDTETLELCEERGHGAWRARRHRRAHGRRHGADRAASGWCCRRRCGTRASAICCRKWRDRMSPTLVRQMDGGEDHTAEMLARALLERTRIYRTGAVLVRPLRRHRHADADAHRAADRGAPVRADRDRGQAGRYRAQGLVSLHAPLQPHRQSGRDAAGRPAQRRPAGRDPARRPPRRGCQAAAAAALFEQARPWARAGRRSRAWSESPGRTSGTTDQSPGGIYRQSSAPW